MIELDDRNPILLGAYLAMHDAMGDPARAAALKAEAIALFARMQGQAATHIGKKVKVSMLVGLYGDTALPAVAMLERLGCLNLLPCKQRFRVLLPWWFASRDQAKLRSDVGKVVAAARWKATAGQPFDFRTEADRLSTPMQAPPVAPHLAIPPQPQAQLNSTPDPAYAAALADAFACAFGAARRIERGRHDA